MKYKGYTAEVEFDDSVGCLHGWVVNSGPYGIRRVFHHPIDEYFRSCEEDGVEAA